VISSQAEAVGSANKLLQQTAAAILVARGFKALGAAAAAELHRSAPGVPLKENTMRRSSLPVWVFALVAVWLGLALGPRLGAEPPAAEKEARTLFDSKRDKLIGGTITSLTFSTDGQRLATADISPSIKVFEVATGKVLLLILPADFTIVQGKGLPVQSLDGPSGRTASLAFSPDGKRLAGGGVAGGEKEPGELKVWEADTGKAIFTLRHQRAILSVVYSPDGKQLAAGTLDGAVKVWDAQTGADLRELRHEGAGFGQIHSVSFSPDGKWLASGGGKGTIKVWEAATGKEVASLREANLFPAVAFSPDSKLLAAALANTGKEQKAVKVWDVATGREVLTLTGATAMVRGVSFSPDGKRLAAAIGNNYFLSGERYEGGTVKVWDLRSGKEVSAFKHESYVAAVSFSPAGKWIAAGDGSGLVKLWKVAD
jgi:WD40 repeat protein